MMPKTIHQTPRKGAKLAGLAAILLLFFACGRASGPPTSVEAQSRSSNKRSHSPLPLPNDPAQSPFIVPPDLAVITIGLSTTQPSFAASTQLLQDKAELLLAKITEGEGCVARGLDYRQPIQPVGQYFRWDADQYTSQIDVELNIALDGLASVTDRIQRLDDCVQRIPQFANKDTKKEEAIAVALSPVLFTLRDSSVYRDELLQKRFAPLQAVADAAQAPGQFRASQTQCTSNGEVMIVARSLSGVELDVNFECTRFGSDGEESGEAEQ